MKVIKKKTDCSMLAVIKAVRIGGPQQGNIFVQKAMDTGGIGGDAFREIVDRSALCQSLGIPPAAKIVGHVGSFRPGVSIFDEVCHIVLARDVRLDLEPACEPGEIIEVHQVPPERALEMARNGEIVDGHTALALLRCEPYLQSVVSPFSLPYTL